MERGHPPPAGKPRHGLHSGVSVPLGAAGRARGDIDLARAERALADTEQTSAQLRLRAQVTALYQEREGAVFAASSLRDQVIPHLTKAVRGAHMAFEKAVIAI